MTWKLAILLLFLASTANAAKLNVISGEHPGFTRIVILATPDIDIELNKIDRNILLSFSNGPHQIILTDAFRRIGRTRIKDLRANETNGLRIELACECESILEKTADGNIILDIRDPKRADFATTPDRDENKSESTTPSQEMRTSLESLAIAQSRRQLPPSLWFPATATITPNQKTIMPRQDGEIAAGLQLHISRGVSQGLLDLSKDQNEIPSERTAQYDAINDLTDEASPRLNNDRPGNQARIDTPIIQTNTQNGIQEGLGKEAIGCLTGEVIDLAAWATENEFLKDLGSLQRDTFFENGRPNQEAARKLARHYLFFGMGAEAKATLAAAGLEATEDPHLFALANILDQDHDTKTGAFASQAHCESSAALWAVLAFDDPSVTANIQVEEVVKAFTALPWHLKDHLGPGLVQRFRAASLQGPAETVLRVIRRATEESSSALRFEVANAAAAENREEEAKKLFEGIAEENRALSPEALVKMIDIEIAAGREIDRETAILAESYALEYRNTPIASDLRSANILALAASLQYEKAFGILEGEGDFASDYKLWSATINELNSKESDIDFVRWIAKVPQDVKSSLEPKVGNASAERLLNLGFVRDAGDFLVAPIQGTLQRERSILRAQAALILNRPLQAEKELSGLEGEDIDVLRAEASFKAGEYNESQTLYGLTNRHQEEEDAAFLGNNWAHFRNAGEERKAAFAKLLEIADDETAETTDLRSLELGRNLLTGSQQARSVIEGLISSYEAPD